MLHKLRRRIEEEKGFTLIELLVVILIIGILAAIALPSFLNQKSKGADAVAKSGVRTAQTAMETCATDNNGDYTNCTAAQLKTIEPALNNANNLTATGSTTGYTVAVQSKDTNGGGTFTITNASGTVTRTCTNAAKGGCLAGGSW